MSSFRLSSAVPPSELEEYSVEELSPQPSPLGVSPWAHFSGLDRHIAEEAEQALAGLQIHRAQPVEPRGQGLPQRSVSSGEDYIQLRELLHKREHELLGLRQALDERDQNMLALRQQMREIEQARQATDARTLTVEKSWSALQQRVEQIEQEKAQILASEQVWKNRMDEMQRKLARTEQLLDASQALASMEREQREVQLAEQQTRMQALLDEQASQFTKQQQMLQDEVQMLQQAMVVAEQQFRAQLAEQWQHAEEQIRTQQTEQQKELAQIREEHARVLLEREEQFRVQQEQWTTRTAQTISALHEKHQDALSELSTSLVAAQQEQKRVEERLAAVKSELEQQATAVHSAEEARIAAETTLAAQQAWVDRVREACTPLAQLLNT